MKELLVGFPKPKKLVKNKKPKPVDYKKKADAVLQELGRKVYDSCEICGGEYSCLHHWIYKSESNALRYLWENCIPVCVRCHFLIHNAKGNLTAGKVVAIRGSKWLYDLEVKKKEGANKSYSKSYFQQKYEEIKNAL